MTRVYIPDSITVKNILRAGTSLIKTGYREIRENKLGQTFPIKPSVLNLLVNDICNSRCQMCLIWTRKRDKELTPDELNLVFQNSLFNKVRYIGVSGGEPTFREDLPEIYKVIGKKSPRIKGTGVITNAIREEEVIDRVMSSAKICKETGIPFNVMVSLDGIGEIHDLVRGRKGNYVSVVNVIRYFRDKTDVPVLIGCTITKDNVWHVDEVLDFCRSENVYGRFRVAEFINRLYNQTQVEYIRNFSEQEKYHLGLFFAKLEFTYERDPSIRRTYRNIRKMLLVKSERSIGCPWQTSGVTLDCRGQLLYCAPRSPVLGNTLQEPALTLYRNNISKRKDIIKQSCPNCIHDYHSQGAIVEWREYSKDVWWRKVFSLDQALRYAKSNSDICSPGGPPSRLDNVLITGWYGTETAGDKAILGEIIYEIRSINPEVQITVASLNPYLTNYSLRELGYSGIGLIRTYSNDYLRLSGEVDQVIMGGGPLMHLEDLGYVLSAFIRAKCKGHHTWIAGCGIGPLDRGEKYSQAVRYILQFADAIELRDQASADWARQETKRDDIQVKGDKAVGYVRRWIANSPKPKTQNYLNLFLRDWTLEYQGLLSENHFFETKRLFESELGLLVRELCDRLDLRPRLLPMHHFMIGNDDRDFNRKFGKEQLEDLSPVIEVRPLSVNEILSAMYEGKYSVCMRFHSVLFAHTLRVPYLAIDYTNGGKIANYLSDEGCPERMLSLQNLAEGEWRDKLAMLLT